MATQASGQRWSIATASPGIQPFATKLYTCRTTSRRIVGTEINIFKQPRANLAAIALPQLVAVSMHGDEEQHIVDNGQLFQ